MDHSHERYKILREQFKDQRLPLAFVDLDSFDADPNIATPLAVKSDKRLRIGTKSLRCLLLMERILAHSTSRIFIMGPRP